MCLCFHILNSHTFWCSPVGQTLPHSLFLVWNHQLAPGNRCCRRSLGGKRWLGGNLIWKSSKFSQVGCGSVLKQKSLMSSFDWCFKLHVLMQTERLDTCRCEDDKAESDAEKYFVWGRAISPRLQQIILAALQILRDMNIMITKLVILLTMLVLLYTFPSRSGSSVGSWSIWQLWVFCWLPAPSLAEALQAFLQQAEGWGALRQVKSSLSLLLMRTLGAASALDREWILGLG